jgi:ParB/RepB/Spo0J family partition protein
MNETKIDYLPLEKIKPSKTNPRKHFDENYILELSDSIRTKGIIQPLSVRPDWCIGKTDEQIAQVNGKAPAPAFFEIVAGECRYRGAVKVKLTEAPAIVRFLSDQETLELQLIENLQRSDLTPIEEAQAYRRLIDEMGYTVDLIHEKTGKDRKTIYGKLKMLKAPKVLLAAIDRGDVAQQMGELVGSIPVPELRERAAKEILSPLYQEMPLNRRQAEEHVRDNYRRLLSGAQFDQKDATLVSALQDGDTGERIGGGACTDCPMRTGNRPELTDEGGGKRGDVCLNPKCFASKSSAHFARLQESAVAEGKRILTDDETEDIFDADGSISFDSPYVKLSDQPDKQEVRSDFTGKLPSWKKLLENVEAKPQIIVARLTIRTANSSKDRIFELVDRTLAIEAVNLSAEQKGETSLFKQTSGGGGGSGGGGTSASSSTASSGGGETTYDRQARQQREKAKVNFQITLAGMTALTGAIDDKGPVKGFWDALIEASITHAGHDGCWLICKRLGLDPKAKNGHTTLEGVQGAALEYGLTLPDEKLKLGYVVELLLSQEVKFSYNAQAGTTFRSVKSFMALAKLYKIDLGEIEKRVREEAKEKAKGKKAKPEPANAGKIHWTRKPEGDFKFNSNGVCEKPATLVLPFPKTTKIKVELHVARAKSGWVSASHIESGVNSGSSGALPSISSERDGSVYGTVREALIDEAAAALKSLAGFGVKPASLKLMGFYMQQIETLPLDDLRLITSKNGKAPTTTAEHDFKKVVGNKYRCGGCGAAAVKHKGKLIVAKDFRGKTCSQSEPKKKTGLTAKMRAKLVASMKARWAARRKAAKKGGVK